MQSGDIVQVQQQDKGIHWIFATVISTNADGSAFVQVRHPGNIEDSAMKFYPAAAIRTKADLQKLAAFPADGQPDTISNAERQSLLVQIGCMS